LLRGYNEIISKDAKIKMEIRERIFEWKAILGTPWRWLVLIPSAVLGIYQEAQQQFVPSLPSSIPISPLWWLIITLVLACILILEGAYRRIRQIKKQLGVIETDPDPQDPNQLKLIDSFPKDNESITKEEVKKIFLKFNKPIHRDNVNEALISNYYVRRNMIRQWNTCGWIEYDEGDTKLIWHVHEDTLQHGEEYSPMEPYDYPMFEIRIPQGETQRRFRAVDGSRLPRTVIRVKIKPDPDTKIPVWSF
jgi:hypothetical protein